MVKYTLVCLWIPNTYRWKLSSGAELSYAHFLSDDMCNLSMHMKGQKDILTNQDHNLDTKAPTPLR